ncbi:MAG: ABC transporter ATP-binding protein [Anaerolineales bacterium]|uniref:ABC transporter ATP-binding protein n=1 Tax=Candidatus Desulfolinea nitratireducens TaxID=2841698 RepID=A0A8J6NLV6_9CHLR|nr:ABC transporter ATP-binding protein [Candidatus Desulfolinea nitratireducens]MBL6961432.1 ABC transporter ATP-binding protein [Anaerolineales bacterium]
MTNLTLTNITKEYEPGKPVLTNLDLQIKSGELLALLGPSGSGKTTVLRLIAGLLAPTFGEIRFDGISVNNIPPEKRGAVMVFQNHAIFPFMSVEENVAFGLRVRKMKQAKISERVEKALSAVKLSGFEDRHPASLSGGQRQRVALARALVVEPKVLLLDEPLSNLEPALRIELRETILSIQKDLGITTIFVTHDQEEAITIADRVALLLDGRLRQVGSPNQFFEQPADIDVLQFFGGANILQGVKRGSSVKTNIGKLEVSQIDWPDGVVTLSIRPEAVEIGANGYNNLSAEILSQKNFGSRIQVDFLVEGQILSSSVQSHHRYDKHAKVVLHIPKERIHLIPFS